MKSGRFFVTYCVLLAIAAYLATQASEQFREHSKDLAQSALVQEGNGRIKGALSVQADLAERFGISLLGREPLVLNNLPKAKRRELWGRLSAFLGSVNQVLEINARKNIIIENREALLKARDRAEILQKNIEVFEHAHGENFDPAVEQRTVSNY